MKILVRIKKCLILVINQLTQNGMMIETDLWLEKRKMKLVVLLLNNLLD